MFNPYNKAEISFHLHTEIGHEGKNSSAFIAHDDQLDAEIVIKKVDKKSIPFLADYFNESRILYLSSHPNVVQIHYACQDADYIYIAMPYYGKGSLNALMNNRFLTVREIVVLGCQIASGLHNIHSKGLVHFDIKPDNVLLSDRGEAVISDFGLSQRVDVDGTAETDRMYVKMVPPEAFTSPTHTSVFDIYQFGITLYRMCNGNAEFYRQFDLVAASGMASFQSAVDKGTFPDRKLFLEHIPDRLRRVVNKCLEPNMSNRYQSVIEVANDLALVDSCLDWQYSEAAGVRSWAKTEDDKEYRLSIDNAGTSVAQKTSLTSGRGTRIADYCKTKIDNREIRRFLGGT